MIQACNAAAMGDLETLQRLKKLNFEMNTGDYDLRTPLHVATSNGQFEIVSFLLENGADPNVVDRWGATPLNDAKDEQIMRILETKGGMMGDVQLKY